MIAHTMRVVKAAPRNRAVPGAPRRPRAFTLIRESLIRPRCASKRLFFGWVETGRVGILVVPSMPEDTDDLKSRRPFISRGPSCAESLPGRNLRLLPFRHHEPDGNRWANITVDAPSGIRGVRTCLLPCERTDTVRLLLPRQHPHSRWIRIQG
jgi:hypothetical protein